MWSEKPKTEMKLDVKTKPFNPAAQSTPKTPVPEDDAIVSVTESVKPTFTNSKKADGSA